MFTKPISEEFYIMENHTHPAMQLSISSPPDLAKLLHREREYLHSQQCLHEWSGSIVQLSGVNRMKYT